LVYVFGFWFSVFVTIGIGLPRASRLLGYRAIVSRIVFTHDRFEFRESLCVSIAILGN
jgi:hypothetical protein